MKEINFSKFYCSTYLVLYSCLLALHCFLAIYFIYVLATAKNAVGLLLGVLMPPVFLLAAKSAFTDIVCFARFHDLSIKPLDDALILAMANRQCTIPVGKNVDVVYCMTGWLIIWPYRDAKDMILLRKSLLGKSSRELCDYFRQKMNYVSGQDKRRMLKSMNIYTYNPLKYLKVPLSNRCETETSAKLS